jgi:hypothetical protein
MKRFVTALAVGILVMGPAPALAQNSYSWAITDLTGSSVSTFTGPGTLFLNLSLYCAPNDGASAAEFDVSSSNPANIVLAFTALNGFLNAGGATNLLLATPCTNGPVVAGQLIVSSNAPGEYCLVPSGNGKKVTVDCTVFLEWQNTSAGFSNVGSLPTCTEVLCFVDSVVEESWSRVKSLYRR